MKELTYGKYYEHRNVYLLSDEPMILHCHHYNCFLQASVEDTRNLINPYDILVDAAHSVVYNQLSKLKQEHNLGEKESLELGLALFKTHGFGVLQAESLTKTRGVFLSPSEHYGVGWLARFGKRNPELPGVAFFARGFTEALVETVFNLPKGSVTCEQTACISQGAEFSRFEYKVHKSARKIIDSPGKGKYEPVIPMRNPKETSVDYVGIRNAVAEMPLEGSDEDGLIHAFGVLLTRMYANYYNLITYLTIEAVKNELGDMGMPVIEALFREAGHVCGFNTLGGIMVSAEWDALILPQLKTREDWMHGIVAVMNALGWGTIRINKLLPGEYLEMQYNSDYENNAFIALNMDYPRPANFLFQGGTVGLMNLLYKADITRKPELNADFYNRLFREGKQFIPEQIKDRRLDGEFSLIAAKLS